MRYGNVQFGYGGDEVQTNEMKRAPTVEPEFDPYLTELAQGIPQYPQLDGQHFGDHVMMFEGSGDAVAAGVAVGDSAGSSIVRGVVVGVTVATLVKLIDRAFFSKKGA